MQPVIGKTFGDYRIIAELGRGATGAVYEAIHEAQGHRVALKIFASELGQNSDFARRFPREVEAMRRLRHRHIVRLYDAGQVQGVFFIALEMMDGGSLEQRLSGGKAMDLPTTVRILAQVAAALDYAHRQGVIHRDVKPSNILFDRTGAAVLTDFGIAKVVGQTGSLTHSGGLLGTPEYVSPEQVQSAKQVDHRTDIYSLGVVAYRMLTGHVPFRRESPWAVLFAHVKEAPPPLSRWNPRVNPQAEQAVLRALAKDPSERYATAGEFVQALAGVTADRLRPTTLYPMAVVGLSVTLVALTALLLRAPERPRPVPPASGPLLAFESDQDGNREIYVADPTTLYRWRLTDHPGQDFSPAWSPSGQHLVFSSDRSGDVELYVMDRRGQGLTRLTNDPATDSGAVWSPDGLSIAFDSDRSGNFDVWIMNSDGTGLRNLTQHQAFDGDPAWSPDGEWIAFESDRDGNYEIYVMPASGGQAQRLTRHSGNDFAPSFSPDGTQIVFECQRESIEICTMNREGGNLRRLTADDVEDRQPQWLADGRILWTRRQGSVWNLFLMDSNGQDMKPWMVTFWSETAPAWSR